MRETVKSLRLYFFVVGGFSLFGVVFGDETSTHWLHRVGMVVSIGIALAMVYAGARLPQLLRDAPGQLKTLILTSCTLNLLVQAALIIVIRATLGSFEQVPWTSLGVNAAITLAISIYLYKNVGRLAQEANPGRGAESVFE